MDAQSDARRPRLLERLANGPVICGEGYLFELERRGYVSAGPFVPEVVLDHPEAVAQLHRDFLHAGSDIVEAFTYYAHRDKLRVIDREADLEVLNRQALRIAKEVAAEGDALFAGNICNTNIYVTDDAASGAEARAMFEEQVAWAGEEGVDLIIAETFSHYQEAAIALEVIKKASLPAVVTIALHQRVETRDGLTPAEACRRLDAEGADVVGLNCARGPATMLPLLGSIREAVSGYLAALPVPYRTLPSQPSFQSLEDPAWHFAEGARPFPTAPDPFTCSRLEIADFTVKAKDLGVNYFGLCCGAGPHHLRSMAQALGRRPAASRYDPDMSRHAFLGEAPTLKQQNLDYADQL